MIVDEDFYSHLGNLLKNQDSEVVCECLDIFEVIGVDKSLFIELSLVSVTEDIDI